jgi:hypothetical protein
MLGWIEQTWTKLMGLCKKGCVVTADVILDYIPPALPICGLRIQPSRISATHAAPVEGIAAETAAMSRISTKRL